MEDVATWRTLEVILGGELLQASGALNPHTWLPLSIYYSNLICLEINLSKTDFKQLSMYYSGGKLEDQIHIDMKVTPDSNEITEFHY